ncbi:MAG TPA: FAD:protein FMN transferase [Solirubrobacterales bacterium]|jgi:thiamine biosynthesis lipoprotein|nr:FAD:protein FMN transferase [Solirubrobacterales bacterium]
MNTTETLDAIQAERREHDVSFDAMGSRVRLLIGEPGPRTASAPSAAEQARRFVVEFDAALSRFKPGSELCALNVDSRERVPASELLRSAVKAGLAAAERSGGLVDPTLVGEIESAGYVASLAGVPGAPLGTALAETPRRRPARPNPEASWRRFQVDDTAGTISRPSGIRFDTGGTGKGLAADMIAGCLRGYSRFVVDCGGDIRIGGADALVRPYDVLVEHPLTGRRPYVLRLGSGAVATSGLGVRIWRNADGSYAHHLLDPSTGEPAWTGLIGATALGATALEAETLAKAALLSGGEDGRAILAERGGLLVYDSGRIETVGPLSARRVPATEARSRAPASLAVRRIPG